MYSSREPELIEGDVFETIIPFLEKSTTVMSVFDDLAIVRDVGDDVGDTVKAPDGVASARDTKKRRLRTRLLSGNRRVTRMTTAEIRKTAGRFVAWFADRKDGPPNPP
ncbi:MAG: hypothetical protein LBF41_03095 [Deltaproteobacteria bacterium]|jgi:hypothetical protein|nr:hypothetical protein [Deltaproteobacteria bacterium]